ncbi:hypothetical protein K431DRAFT_230888, partial [Polychaeton citri CBS 116435]
MRSFLAAATCLAFIRQATAGVVKPGNANRDAALQNRVVKIFNNLFKKDTLERRAGCTQDEYWNFVHNSTFGQGFCQQYYGYSDTTIYEETTPVSTTTDTYTTITNSKTEVVRTTPTTTVTVTVTPSNPGKRDAEPSVTAGPVADIADVFNMFRRQQAASNSPVPGEDSLSVSFSSACSCQQYHGPSVTVTYTNSASIQTISAYAVAATTTTVVRTAAMATTSTTVTVMPNSTTSGFVPTPTAHSIECPAANGTVQMQMVGPDRYDFFVLCDTELLDPNFYSRTHYDSFNECVGACSALDDGFQDAVCQGVSYDPSASPFNCALKSSSNQTRAAPGRSAAILQRI